MKAGPPLSVETPLLYNPDDEVESLRSARNRNPSYGTSAEDGDLSDLKLPDLETTWQNEASILAKSSIPLILTYLLQYSFNFVTVYVAGRLGTKELGAASLASMTASITGICIFEGLATSLDTLTSQAYGNNKKQLVGLHVQRMVFLMCLITIPIGIIWICSPWILAALIPEKEIAILSGSFLRIYLVGLPGWAIFEAGKRFTQAQGDFSASLVVLLISAPLNVLLNYVIVFRFSLGFEGAALAVAISNSLLPVFLALYVYFVVPSTLQCWPGFEIKRVFQNWGPMIKLGLPGVLMTFSEWLAFEILTLSTAYLGTEYLAAQSILSSVCVAMYHIPFPMSIAASTRFGNLIGYGALPAARTAWRTHYAVFLCLGLIDLTIITSGRHIIAAIFTDDERVRELAATVMPIMAAIELWDALTAISNALLRGLGRQKIGGWANLAAYYVFALPLAFTLAFGPPHLKLIGLWIGPCVGLALCFVVTTAYMLKADWEKAVADARSREE